MNLKHTFRTAILAAALALSGGAQAAAIHDAGLFMDSTLAANDDGSTGLVATGISMNFFGTTYTSLYVNNNGNVTFTTPLSTFTPFGLLSSSIPIIAPFFADVDTRGLGSGLVQYGTDTLAGRAVFGVNWIDVGYFASHTSPTNSFQMILTDRSDIGAGDFDIQFNYDRILWETGDASGGSGGLGGSSVRMGYTDGGTNDYEQLGSGVNGAFLDGNAVLGLIHNSLNSSIDGQYNFFVRNGIVITETPEPGSLALLGLALASFGFSRRRKN